MDIIKGNITRATQPGEPQGQFGVRYQDITITDDMGLVYNGRIGSKQGYAMGAYLEVTSEQKVGNNGPYMYFKKYNPQYGGQPQGQYTPQPLQQPQQGPSVAPQSTNAAKPDWDAKDERIVRQNTLNRAVELYIAAGGVEWPMPAGHQLMVMKQAEDFRNYVYNGLSGQPNPGYVGGPAPDDVPEF